MKIVFTGGGTGGHFYPIIAVAEALRQIRSERRELEPELFYIAPSPYDEEALFANGIRYIKSPAGKVRRYASFRNLTDPFVTLWGTFWCLVTLFRIYPDVVFSKGGYASVPTVLAAHLLRIPIIIHESDAKPGRANILASRFATHIAVSFDDSEKYFPLKSRSKIAKTGIPLRKALAHLDPSGGITHFNLDTSVPTVLILGGSSGSVAINEVVLAGLTDLVSHVNVIHQTGKEHYKEVAKTAEVILHKHPFASRYHVQPFFSGEHLKMAAGAAHVIVSRAGATAIAEASLWRRPAILIPIPEDVSHDQRTNAYSYAHTGAAVVLEQANLTPHVLVSEIRRIAENPSLGADMGRKGAQFSDGMAATRIAEALLSIGRAHDITEEKV
jgi:UDP-N-acetylglucosamine--N-acetylmuramyl-(pentapeptide) pyrophosphoryl-undecaprenol N-acetylglucosamine transferase